MNTTAAAVQAGVTIPTIRRWCRYGVVAAVKRAGRWTIEAASLAYRIAIGRENRMEITPTYQVIEGSNKYGNPTYTVARTDGAKNDFRLFDATYQKREHAEFHAEFLNRTPDEYRIKRDHHRARSIRQGFFWKISGGRNGDPSTVNSTWDDGQEVHGDRPEGTTPVDVLVGIVLLHDAGAADRIAKKADADAIAAAEAAVREARQAQLDEIARRKGPLATERQVDYILQLLAAREISGEGGGFFTGPKTRAGLEELSKVEASNYITSLTGNY